MSEPGSWGSALLLRPQGRQEGTGRWCQGARHPKTSGMRPWHVICVGGLLSKPSEGWEPLGPLSMEKGHSQASCIVQGTWAAQQGLHPKVWTGSQTRRRLPGDYKGSPSDND